MAISPAGQLRAIEDVVRRCQKGKFWGKVTLIISNGNLVEIISNQTLKPEKVLSGADQVLVNEDAKEKEAWDKEAVKNFR